MLPNLIHIDTWLELLTLVLLALVGGGIAALVKAFGDLEKLRKDAALSAKKSELDTLREVIATLQVDNTRLRTTLHEVEDRYEKRIAELEAAYRAQCDDYERRIDDMEAEIAKLQRLLRENGITLPVEGNAARPRP